MANSNFRPIFHPTGAQTKGMTDQFSPEDEEYMRLALTLAGQAQGRTSPNPMVGCVVVRNGQIVGQGYHRQAGTPHAEVHALAAAGDEANGATLYVTLEPCSHFGRTPPCADAIIRAGVKRVVAAMVDPNPLVAGKGLSRLRAAGIEVATGLLATEAARLNEAFIKAITIGLPLITYKAAFTVDGKLATASGDSRWVSSEASRQLVHQMRNRYDVIMVGSETVLLDDPQLNCRYPGGRDPIRLVVDGELRTPVTAQILRSSATAPCILATTQAAPAPKLAQLSALPGVEIWSYPTPRYVPLPDLAADIRKRGWNSVLLEGGGKLAGAMLAAGLIDKVEFFLAPKLLGGDGLSPFAGGEPKRMADALHLYDLAISLATGDIHLTAYLHPPALKAR